MVNEISIIIAIVASTFTILASIISLLAILYRSLGRIESRIVDLDKRVSSLEERMNSLENRINSLENRISSLESRVSSLEVEVRELGRRITSIENRVEGFNFFAGSLIGVLSARNIVDVNSATFLTSILRSGVRSGQSKYYKREDYEKVMAITSKRIDEITHEDVEELKRIIGLIRREIDEMGRMELLDTLVRLELILAIYTGYLLAKSRSGEGKSGTSSTPGIT